MSEYQSSTPVLLAPEGVRRANTAARVPYICDLFRMPQRYLRSVHLERDFDDTPALRHYVVTPPIVAVFSRIVEGLRPGAGHRAWRITGDYGTGKSSFALMLAHLLCDPGTPALEHVRHAINQESEGDARHAVLVPMVPVLVTGAREPLVPAVARAVGQALERVRGQRRTNRLLEDVRRHAAAVATAAEASQLLDLLDHLGGYATQSGHSGVLVVLDELGKFLEYAALHPDHEDVYILQRLAEVAGRSGECPLLVLGLLHQGFHAYAERLPSITRLEWEKVAGRYDEITFDQPLAHIAALVASALNVDRALMPEDVATAAESMRTAMLGAGWYGSARSVLAPLELYPLHPTVLPVLVRFFARFGQHERSLFSFLLSSEPFGLQSFAERPATRDSWYRLPDFYDYIRSVFGHRLAGASYRSHWLRITETLDRVTDVDALALRVLKTVAVLNVLDAEHLLATDAVLGAAIADGDAEGAVGRAVAYLKRRGLLFHRGAAGGYCLWPSTSVSLESAFELAQRTLGPVDRIAAHLGPYLDTSARVARRHYTETGTLRHFEVRYTELAALLEAVTHPTDADGLVVVTLCESADECHTAATNAEAREVASRPEVIVAVPPPFAGMAAEVQDARCWQWVAHNVPELAHDAHAAAEVARQVATSQRALLRRLTALFGFHGEHTDAVQWWRCGRRFDLPVRGGLSAALSTICDELYNQAPRIRNELLNRRTLSSAAAAARLRLIARMFSAADQPALGMESGKAPPEKSMYLSVLSAGNVHREEDGQFVLAEPPEGADLLRLRPSLIQIVTLLEQGDGHRVPVTRILHVLQGRPYGVRMGVAPLLLAIVAVARAHEIAVYEHGTFLPRFGAPDFLRLIKQPAAFEFQLCRVVGVRVEVFVRLARMFASERPSDRDPGLLDVVGPLSKFAAQLPEYTRGSASLPEPAQSVRDALLIAREPATLLFTTLPSSCGLRPFAAGEPVDVERAQQFVDALWDVMADLRATYPHLLERIRDRIARGLAAGGLRPDRASTARRARTATTDLCTMPCRCGAVGRRVGGFVLSKPPARWITTDETRAMDEIDLLAATFCRVEATTFTGDGDEPNVTAIRLGLTLGDGSETARVVCIRIEDEIVVQELATKVEQVLAEAYDLKLAAITRVLWKSLVDDAQFEQQTRAAKPPFSAHSSGGAS